MDQKSVTKKVAIYTLTFDQLNGLRRKNLMGNMGEMSEKGLERESRIPNICGLTHKMMRKDMIVKILAWIDDKIRCG